VADNGWNYTRTSQRYYRGALEGLRRAVAAWVAHRGELRGEERERFFVLQLGDLLDGFNAPADSERAVATLLGELEALGGDCPVHHCLGNHELYNFPRAVWKARLPCFAAAGPHDHVYYAFSPHPRYRPVPLTVVACERLGSLAGPMTRGKDSA
jgi:hypothetical protein